MRASICAMLALVAVAGLSLPASSQVSRSRTTAAATVKPAHTARLPYTAEYKVTRVRTLANGSTVTRESTEVVALDSGGRRMNSKTLDLESEDGTPKMRIAVFDPVARTNSVWTVPGQKVTVAAMPVPGERSNCATKAPALVAPEAKREMPAVEDLGIETIHGIESRGSRTVSTIPAGESDNDAPMVRTSELWTATAPGLRGLLAREVNDDPRSDKMTKELTSFTQAEPDETVFQPPAGYEIENKAVPVPACPSAQGAPAPMAPIPPPPPPPEQ